ncbi:GTP-binding protein Der [Candidatus Mycoplasma haematolamae str. Purdue]|uniref:GTPase Der n=1 Tax=Mycoplasma haematolamae (strain Purdue) TaxID=1212765 RepID=I7BJF2_MYCHA|nr:ribosome biogenesis GTPase Der [Candidatus Mycoplasma haematolamae]AFO51968.1 GTP-binding protein Der [Candidatus Mycoplasma haematolamae str. Purdue]
MPSKSSSLPRVLIVGATNVGKSQLFNRLVKDRHAIVLNRESLTRDLILRQIKLCERELILIDSGGYSEELSFQFQPEMNRLLIEELKRSSVVLFLFSTTEGIRSIEWKISKLLHKNASCPVLLVGNKIDCKKKEESWRNFASSLGFGEPILISAEHDINIMELSEQVERSLGKKPEALGEIQEEHRPTRLGIVGKVNVGKSSLVNSLLCSELVISSPIEGTTIDLVEHSLNYRGKMYLLIDSPGWKKLKKEGLRNEELDHLSMLRAKKAIRFADVLLFLVDLSVPMTYIDEKVAKEIFDSNLPVVIVVNKWDLLDYSVPSRRDKYEKMLREKFYYLTWAPIVFVSAKYSKKLGDIFKALQMIEAESSRLFSQAALTSFLSRANLFLLGASKAITLQKIMQVKSSIPTFVVHCSNPDNLSEQQMRLVESQFRSTFKLTYSPLKFYYKKS